MEGREFDSHQSHTRGWPSSRQRGHSTLDIEDVYGNTIELQIYDRNPVPSFIPSGAQSKLVDQGKTPSFTWGLFAST